MFYGTDNRRQKVFGRFYRDGLPPLKIDLCSIDALDYKETKRGLVRRSDAEREKFLQSLYAQKQQELQRAASKKQDEQEAAPVLVGSLVDDWLADVAAFRDKKTVLKYRHDLKKWINANGNHNIASMPPAAASNFKKFLDEQGLSPNSINSAIRSVRVFFGWCVDQNHISKRPKLSSLRVTQKQPKIYSPDQLQQILAQIETEYENARNDHKHSKRMLRRVFYMMRYTGMRNSELRNLKWQDIQHNQILIRDNESAEHQVKGRQEAFIPISTKLQEFIKNEERTEKEIYFLDNGFGRQQWTNECSLTRAMRRLLDRVGIADTKPLHSFRATVASELLNDPNTNPFLVKQLLRHRDIKTTLGYANTNKIETETLVNKLAEMSSNCR